MESDSPGLTPQQPTLRLHVVDDEQRQQALAECTLDDVPGQDFATFWCRTALAGIGRLDAVLPGEQTVDPEISLALVDRQRMQELNHEFRGRDKVTNILSFPAAMPPLPGEHGRLWQTLGDLCVCPAVVEAEAIEQGKQLRHHWAHLLVHGVLHLCGHDHQAPSEAEIMESIERDVLAEHHIPDPYKTHPESEVPEQSGESPEGRS